MNPGAAGTASFALISFILLIPAFSWHIKCRNIPATLLIFWLMLVNLIGSINTLIWSSENFDQVWDGKGWCDLTIKLEAGSSSGKICAIACLSMNLYMILCAKNPLFMEWSWKKTIIELSICLITPIFIMCTQYIIQGSRYGIVKYQGCVVNYSATTATLGLYSMWSVIWSILAFIFAILTIYKYLQKRKDVKDIFKCTNSGLNIKRFARLLIFSFLIIIAMFPLSVYYFVEQAKNSTGKFNWDEVHHPNWDVILYYDFGFFLLYDRIVNSILSVLTFLLFGIGTDALTMYRGWLRLKKNSDTPLSKQTTFVKVESGKSQYSSTTTFTQPTLQEFHEFKDVLQEFHEIKDVLQESDDNIGYKYEVKAKV
ncbi:unnamed protein product [Candida verbasci]|uniref:Pheromone a factor receptor n=1 Tax=Candida verbasci TaxID=1227364 RepID=A0A9W4TY59_9ASCO|nr:unnamed protein product [Candida verbasci]